jgi:hypothetical protein
MFIQPLLDVQAYIIAICKAHPHQNIHLLPSMSEATSTSRPYMTKGAATTCSSFSKITGHN